MKKLKHKFFLAFAIIFTINFVFSQRKQIDSLQLVIPEGLEAFTKKITIKTFDTSSFEDSITLRSYPFYSIHNLAQDALFSSENNLISGTVTTSIRYSKGEHKEGDSFKIEYTFEKSLVTKYIIFADDKLFLEVYRKDYQVLAKEFDKNGKLTKEFETSLKPDKSYGLSITKSYDKDGKIYQIDDETNQTITQFYTNGNKKSMMDKTSTSYFDENGIITRKANFIGKPFYDDVFLNGKLHSRSYKNIENEEVKEYFKNDTKEKKEITKTINGEKITFVYDKSERLTSKKPYVIKNQKVSESTLGKKDIATSIENPIRPSKPAENGTEAEIISANFPNGNEAFRKFVTDNFDNTVTENEGTILFDLNFTVNIDGTISLENHQQKISPDKDLSNEMNRILKKSPKWNPATQNGIPVKSSVRFPIKINIQ